MMRNPVRTWLLRHHPYPFFLKAWYRLVVLVVLLALLPYPQRASLTEESPVHQPNQTSQMHATDYLGAPIPRPASPFASVPRLTNCHPHLALLDLIQILQWFPHRTLVILLMLNCSRRSLPQLVRTGGR